MPAPRPDTNNLMRDGEARSLTVGTIRLRHLSVPNLEVDCVLDIRRENGWLASGMRIFPSEEGDRRLVPLNILAPATRPPPLETFDIAHREGLEDDRIDSDWLNHLSLLVDQDVLDENREEWPSSHEFIGDMMIVYNRMVRYHNATIL